MKNHPYITFPNFIQEGAFTLKGPLNPKIYDYEHDLHDCSSKSNEKSWPDGKGLGMTISWQISVDLC